MAWLSYGCGVLGGDPPARVEPAEPGAAARERPGSSAASSPAVAAVSLAAGPSATESLEPAVAWRFRSATSLSGAPAVSPAGPVYVASVEGFLHALDARGAYRWSFGLEGMPIGAPAVDRAGQVYVATTAQRLYAFKPDGRLSWLHRARTRFATPPVWAAPGLLYYVGRDRNLYSLPGWGGAAQSQWLGADVDVPLASVGDGLVAVGMVSTEAQVFRRAAPLGLIELADEPAQPLLGGKEYWYAVTRVGLAAFDVTTRSLEWTAPARRAALSADQRLLLLEVEGELVWFTPESWRERHRVRLSGEASGPPVVANSGVALVPMMSGELLVIDPQSGRRARVDVGPGPVWPPVWREASQHVTAAAAGGVVDIDLSRWSGSVEGAGDVGRNEVPNEPAGDAVPGAEPHPELGAEPATHGGA